MLRALSFLFGLLMVAGTLGHVISPELYAGFIPAPIPEALANGLAAVVEAAIGVSLFIPRTRARAGLAFAVLMVAFLPLHIWDALKEAPAIGSHTAAYIRLVVQALFIAGGVVVFRDVPAACD